MTYTLETLAQEQKRLLLEHFDYDFAWQLGVLMRERAANTEAPVAITVAHGPDSGLLGPDARRHARQLRLGSAQARGRTTLPSQLPRDAARG